MKMRIPKNIWAYAALVLAVLAFATVFFDAAAFTGEDAKTVAKGAEISMKNEDEKVRRTVTGAFESGGVTLPEARSMVNAFQSVATEDTYVPGDLRTLANFVLIAQIVSVVAVVYLIFGLLAGFDSAGYGVCAASLLWLVLALVLPGKLKSSEWSMAVTLWPFAGLVLGAACAFIARMSAKTRDRA